MSRPIAPLFRYWKSVTALCLLWASAAWAAGGGVEIPSVNVDGKETIVGSRGSLRLSPNPGVVSFVCRGRNNLPIRIQHRLEGVDTRWMDDGGAYMFLAIRYFDSAGEPVSQTTFPVAGESSGWKGNLADSDFTHHREMVVVPPRAASFWVVISSAGPPGAVGLFVVDNLVASRIEPDGTRPRILLQTPQDFREFNTDPNIAPPGWVRDGTSPSMARIVELGRDHTARAFAIFDENPTGHAEWHSIRETAPKVAPGDQLLIEWNDLFTIGSGSPREVRYKGLASGEYRLRVMETTSLGRPTENIAALIVIVPPPFWKNPLFWALVLCCSGGLGVGSYRYVVRQRMRRELARLEKQRLIAQERLRIAQDIHDDLGARVTQISLFSGMSQGDASLSEKVRGDFGHISQMSRELVNALYETVWAVSPENDNLEALETYLCQMTNHLCEQSQLRCRLHVGGMPAEMGVSCHVRHNAILAVKEAVHNVIKHAKASEVVVRVALDGNLLSISVHDDGAGFDSATSESGNGLKNMRKRMEKLGGTCTIESQPGKGTTVRMELKITPVE